MSRMPGVTLPANLTSFAAKQREQAAKQREHLGVEARSWYRITNAAGAESDEAEILLYDEIGGWWGCTADEFIAELRQVTASNVRVRINSPGGSVFEGIAIANALRSHPANVVVQVDSLAASIASVIAMAGDRVEMAPNSMLMIHDAAGLCIGSASDMEEMGQLLDLISDNIADAYVAKAGGTRDQWREAMRAESWYLPDGAVEAGLADEAMAAPKTGDPVEPAPEKDEPDMEQAWDLSLYGYTGPRQETALTEDVRSLIGEEVATQLAAAVAPAEETDAEQPVDEPAAEPASTTTDPEAPEAVAEDEEPAAEADTDDWTAMVAALVPDDADAWSALVSNLIEPDTSSSAATA
jgi:ATP-dependent protease ClpP protease subunit